MIALERAVAEGRLRPLDLHFAGWMGRLSASRDPALLLAAALVSRRVGEGDVCLDLRQYAGHMLLDDEGTSAPPLVDWVGALRAVPVVGEPGETAPLILDGHERLYLHRYWCLERNLAQAIRARAGLWAAEVDRALLRKGLARLFPSEDAPDWQRIAAAVAVLRPFCVVSGGPGTGKTRTVTAILALLLEQAALRHPAGRHLRIALATPTGKAAARLAESLHQARARLDLDPAIAAAIPEQVVTLHRLLGFRPGRAVPRHGPDDLLHADVLVVDEASMVDLPMMARLVTALRPHCRLILLGDKDQLASVEAGMVLGDLCGRGAESVYTPAQCQALEEIAGAGLASGSPGLTLSDHIVSLRKGYRFGESSGIGALARAVNAGDGEAALTALADHADLQLLSHERISPRAYVREHVVPAYRAYLETDDPAATLEAFAGFHVLCAVREGPYGVYALNRLVEEALQAAGLIQRAGDFYHGRPVMVTRNDYALGLYNGDIGLVLRDPEAGGSLRMWFQTPDGLRRVLPTRLPGHETVYAMTVHKSQGSEFGTVHLVLPDADSRVVTRELLYTGITRARERVLLLASPARLRQAARQRVTRSSGLYDALWGGGEL